MRQIGFVTGAAKQMELHVFMCWMYRISSGIEIASNKFLEIERRKIFIQRAAHTERWRAEPFSSQCQVNYKIKPFHFGTAGLYVSRVEFCS